MTFRDLQEDYNLNARLFNGEDFWEWIGVIFKYNPALTDEEIKVVAWNLIHY